MSNAPFQSLLMDSNAELPEPETPTCVADQYYSCGPENDPYWDNVVLMLHGDGADGGTTFTDSSEFARTVSIGSGSPTTVASPSKFGSAAINLNGYQYSLSTPHAAELSFGSGALTIEFWVYVASSPTFSRTILQKTAGGTSGFEYRISVSSGPELSVVFSTGSSQFGTGALTGLSLNTWTHVAVSWAGSGQPLYCLVNGRVTTSTTATGTFNSTTPSTLVLGNSVANPDVQPNVYIDDLRITKGVARYTGNFTIPTAAFPDAQEVSTAERKLLINYEYPGGLSASTGGIYVDKTPIPTITQVLNDHQQSAPYKKWGDLGSFQSSGGLVIGPSHKLVLGTADFFLDFWFIQANGFQLWDRVLVDTKYAGGVGFRVSASRGANPYRISFRKDDGTYVDDATTTLVDTQQYYLAIYRISGVMYVQLDSTVLLSFADTTDYTGKTWCFGNDTTLTNIFNGGFDEINLELKTVSSPVALPVAAYDPFYSPRTVLSLHGETSSPDGVAGGETFASGIADYTVASGVSTPFVPTGSTLAIAAVNSGTINRITKDLGESRRLIQFSFDCLIVTSNSDDAPAIYLSDDSGLTLLALFITPRRETSFDANRRIFTRAGATTTASLMGSTGLTVGTTYNLTYDCSDTEVTLTVTDLSDNSVFFAATVPSSTSSNFRYLSFTTDAGGLTCAAEYSNITWISKAQDTADVSCYQEKTATLTGSATVSTDQAKYGLSSFYIPNTGVSAAHGVVVTDHQDFDFGTLDFTIECWAYRNANTYTGRLFTGINGTTLYAEVGTDGLLNVVWSSSAGTSSRLNLVSVPLTQWNHFAFQRRGGTVFEVFLNGVLVDSVAVAASATLDSTGDLYWGRTSASSATSWNGYIDEINIVRGAARYLPAGFDPADLAWCDSTTAGGQIATSGTEYPRTLQLTTGQGNIGLLNHYVTLSGQAATAATGRAFLSNVSSPSGVSRNYALTRTLSADASGTFTITGQIILAATGALQVSNANNVLEIYNQNWLTPTGAGVASDYEIRLTYASGSGAFTLGLSQFGDGNWVDVDSNLTGTLIFSGAVTPATTSLGATAALTFSVRPRATSPLYDPGYLYSFTLTLNYSLLKPASAAATYPDLESSTYSSEGADVLEFRSDGTLRVVGATVGRWVESSGLLPGIANQFKLQVSADPLPAGYTRLSNAAVSSFIKSDLSVVNKFNLWSLGTAANTGANVREGFTVRAVPLLSNPRYGEAGYYSVHTVTIFREQLAGF